MSEELEDRLSYLRDNELEKCSVVTCCVKFLSGAASFRVIGWDQRDGVITIESPERYLGIFFREGQKLKVDAFETSLSVTDTSAIRDDGLWKVNLFLRST